MNTSPKMPLPDSILEHAEAFLEASDILFDKMVHGIEQMCLQAGAHPRFDCAICYNRALKSTSKCQRCKSRFHNDCLAQWQHQSGKTHCMYCFAPSLTHTTAAAPQAKKPVANPVYPIHIHKWKHIAQNGACLIALITTFYYELMFVRTTN